jgi:hypothetical protein
MNLSKLLKELKSWKTTALGFLGGLMLVIPQIQAMLDDDPETIFVKSLFMTGLAMMGFGIAAKDGDKSTEDVS